MKGCMFELIDIRDTEMIRYCTDFFEGKSVQRLSKFQNRWPISADNDQLVIVYAHAGHIPT